MSKRHVLLWIATVVCLMDVALGWAACVTFTPADPRDTDTAVLIDNFKVTIDGTAVNPNFNFEAGTLTGFGFYGDARVIGCLGSIFPPDNSKFFAVETTGPGADTSPFNFSEWSGLTQNFAASAVTRASLSVDFNLLTNENATGKRHNDSFGMNLHARPQNGCCPHLGTPVWRGLRSLPLIAAPADTGFKFQTGVTSITVDITTLLQDAIGKGFTSFFINTHVNEDITPLLDVVLNKTSFKTGDEVIISAHVTSEAKPVNTEVRIWVRLPSGLLVDVLPPLHTQPIAAREDITVELLRYKFSGFETIGFYNVNARMYEAGHLDFIDDENTKGFSFSP